MTKISWPRRLMPLIVIEGYLWGTVALFIYGPWNWEISDLNRLLAFIGSCHVALAIGFLALAHRAPLAGRSAGSQQRLLSWTLGVTLVLLPLTSYARTGQFIPDFIGGLRNPGEAYALAHMSAEGGTNFAAYLRIIASPMLVLLVPLTVFFWQTLSRKHRILCVTAVSGVLLMTVATGQRRDIADLLVTLPFVVVAASWAGIARWSKRSRYVTGIVFVVSVAAFLSYFVYSHVSRVGESTALYAANPATGQLPTESNSVLALIPDEIKPGAFAFLNYVTTGYYGLSLSLDREWKPMYGAGHSMFLTRNVEKYVTGKGFESRSLPVQISEKDGFRYPVLWCTAYPYFINDLGPVGVVLLMALIGALLAVSWLDTVGARDPLALTVFWLTILLVMYLPATNRVLQDGEGVFSFYVLVGIYLYYRGRASKVQEATA